MSREILNYLSLYIVHSNHFYFPESAMDILALSNLLTNPAYGASEENQEDEPTRACTHQPPAPFGARHEPPTCSSVKDTTASATPTNSNTPEEDHCEPAYQIYYTQVVGTEDVFLGTEKSPASSDCTHLVVKVHFPSCTMKDLTLDVTSTTLTAKSESSNKYVVASIECSCTYFSHVV